MPRLNDRINQAKIEMVRVGGYLFGKHRDSVIRYYDEIDSGAKERSPTKYAFWDGVEMSPWQIKRRMTEMER